MGCLALWVVSAASVFGALVVFGVLAALAAPLYVPWLAPGFSPLELAQTAAATRLMLPALGLMGLATVATSILQAYRRFAISTLATAVYNATFIGILLLAPLAWPVGRAAWGVTFGAAAALVIQLPLLWRLFLSESTGRRAGEPHPAGHPATTGRAGSPVGSGVRRSSPDPLRGPRPGHRHGTRQARLR